MYFSVACIFVAMHVFHSKNFWKISFAVYDLACGNQAQLLLFFCINFEIYGTNFVEKFRVITAKLLYGMVLGRSVCMGNSSEISA